MVKKAVVINCHPRENSFCSALLKSYVKGLQEKEKSFSIINLRDLPLEEFLKFGHSKTVDLPQRIRDAQQEIVSATHLTFFYPIWWATPPALLKVFLEVVLQSGVAYKYTSPLWVVPRWDRLLKGKTARLIVTMDSPPWHYRFIKKDPGMKMMKDVLEFCGVKVKGSNYFGSVVMSTKEKRECWLEKTLLLGKLEK